MDDRFVLMNGDTNEELTFHGIPFQVKRENGVVKELPNGSGKYVKFEGECEALFFLGMVTRSGEGSEWWGQWERNYDHSRRVFIGDKLGRIHVIYEDETQETIAVIFGVNLWNYDLFENGKEWEAKEIRSWFGPHREPFASDPEAEKLRYEANCMMENNDEHTEKMTKWVFGIKTRPDKKIAKINFRDEEYKRAGFSVSSVTGLKKGCTPDADWRIIDPDFFVRRDYAQQVDRLSRRLYQYADELPEQDPLVEPENFDAPDVRFKGNGLADILTNVYRTNMMDMAYDKIDDTGRGHTSSKKAPYFGCYIGFGTWVPDKGSYYNDIWSRDVGRVASEVVQAGYCERIERTVKDFHVQLYNEGERYPVPCWWRVANVTKETRRGLWESVQCAKENDGHGALMLAIYNYYYKSGQSKEWLLENRQALLDAANWIFWQIENPAGSNFDRVLYSESEASDQFWGGYDLFSNSQCMFALAGYAKMFRAMDDDATADKCMDTVKLLWKGCMERFGQNHFKYGKTLTDTTDDGWSWEYKRFAPLFLMADVAGYDVKADCPELYELMSHSFDAQKDEYYAPEAGRQMGYGQGYLNEAVILLDRYEEITDCMNATAKFCYHHTDFPYIVPEGVIMHGSKRYWFRNSDLGNAVQQAEIMKSIRLLVGIDDLSRERGLRLIPRLPDTFSGLEAKDFALANNFGAENGTVKVNFSYERTAEGYDLSFSSPVPVKVASLRMGPYPLDKKLEPQLDWKWTAEEINGRRFINVQIDQEIDSLHIAI